MTGYYDYVLCLIPLTLGGITAALTTTGVSLTLAVPLAASVAVVVIAHALFVNGPVDRSEPRQASRSNPVNAD
ncbi:MAG: hypothetical protein ACQETI_01425 [Halobacteriota archaeon]